MASITPTELHASSGRDIEKDHYPIQPAAEVPGDTKTESDNDSTHVQEGVKTVEAITTVWSKKSLWSTFALYVITANNAYTIRH